MQFIVVNNYQEERFQFNALMENVSLLQLYNIGTLGADTKKNIQTRNSPNSRLETFHA